MKIGIVGYGYVGRAFKKMIENHYEYWVYDPNTDWDLTQKDVNNCDLAVVCVPTPMAKDGSCDTSIVEETIKWLKTPVILIKSTIPPGTTEYLKKKYKKRIVMSPELIGEGNYFVPIEMDFSKDMKVTPFLVVGGSKKDVNYVMDILVPILGPTKQYMRMTTTEAELMKYVENYFLALKVIFSNEMKEICEAFGADYYRVREGWLADPRVSKFHAIVFPGKEGFSGKCLPKDNNSLLKACESKGYNPTLLKAMLKANKEIRKRHNLLLDY